MNDEFTKFIKKLILFFLFLFLFIIVINWIYINFVVKKQQYYRQNLAYQEYINSLQDKKISFAFFGDSHTRNAIDPRLISGSFNFGTSAENYIETYYKLKKIIELDKVKLGAVVLETDLVTFSSLMTDDTRIFDDVGYYYKFVPYSEIKKIKNYSNLQMIKLYLTDVYFPSIGKGEDFVNIFIKPKLTEVYLGWTKEYGDYSLTDMKESALGTYNLQFANKARISNISFEYFLKAIDLAKKNNIKIVFVKYPISKELADIIKENNFDVDDYYNRIFGEVDKKLNGDYSVLDYYDIFFDHPDYFTNPDHLNYKGADILTKKVKEDIIK